jgi:hypothetical protein
MLRARSGRRGRRWPRCAFQALDRGATPGHIRATNDQIAADNTGHHRSGIGPAHSAGSATLQVDRTARRSLTRKRAAVAHSQDTAEQAAQSARSHVRIVTSAAGLGSYKVEQALQVGSFAIGCSDWTVEMTIGVGIFLMVLGAILAFAVQTDVPGINVNSLGIILLLIGLVAVLYSLVFWSNLTPWGRRRIIARRRLVGGTRTEEMVEERPLDDGLP